MPPMTQAALQAAIDMNNQIVALSEALRAERARAEAAEAQIAAIDAERLAALMDAARLYGAVQGAKVLLSLAEPRPGVTPEWQAEYERWLRQYDHQLDFTANRLDGRE